MLPRRIRTGFQEPAPPEGVNLVAISPQIREVNGEVEQKHRVTYPLPSNHHQGAVVGGYRMTGEKW
jgi:hypothetical protein